MADRGEGRRPERARTDALILDRHREQRFIDRSGHYAPARRLANPQLGMANGFSRDRRDRSRVAAVLANYQRTRGQVRPPRGD